MNRINQHEALDKVLRYLVDEGDTKLVHSSIIAKDVFPDEDKDVVNLLLQKLLYTEDEIVSKHIRNESASGFSVYFRANGITKSFLNDHGGFTKLYENEQKKKNEEKRAKELNKKLLETNLEVAEFQRGLGKKLAIWAVVISVVSVIASLFTTILQNQSLEDRINLLESQTSIIDSLQADIQTLSQEYSFLTDSLNRTNIQLKKSE